MKAENDDLKERYSNWSNERLFEVLLNHTEYTQFAINAAIDELKKRKLDEKVKEILEKKVRQEEETLNQELKTAELFTSVNLEKKISLVPASPGQMLFEGLLIENNIDFVTNEDHTTRGHLVDYLFSNDNYDKAIIILENMEFHKPSEEHVSEIPENKYYSLERNFTYFILALFAVSIIFCFLYLFYNNL